MRVHSSGWHRQSMNLEAIVSDSSSQPGLGAGFPPPVVPTPPPTAPSASTRGRSGSAGWIVAGLCAVVAVVAVIAWVGARSDSDEASERADSLAAINGDLEGELAVAESARDSLQADLDRARSDLDALNATVDELEAARSTAENEADVARQEADAARADADSLRDDLASASAGRDVCRDAIEAATPVLADYAGALGLIADALAGDDVDVAFVQRVTDGDLGDNLDAFTALVEDCNAV